MPLFALSLEGIVKDVRKVTGGAEIDLMGMTVFIDSSMATSGRITTASQPNGLTIDQLTSPVPLQGRTEPGFIGGSAIINGNYNTDVTPPRLEAIFIKNDPIDGIKEPFPSVEIGPPESVLGGPLTANAVGSRSVNGTPVELLNNLDLRLPLIPPQNEFGFDLHLEKVPLLTATSVDGYYSESNKSFIGYKVVVDSNDEKLLLSDKPQVSITKAQSRLRGGLFDVSVRGGVTVFHPGATDPQRIEIYRLDRNPAVPPILLGRETARVVPGKPFSKWSFSARLPVDPTALNPAPTQLRVINASPDAASANAGVAPFFDELHVEVIKG